MDSHRQLQPTGPKAFGSSKCSWKRQNNHSKEGGRSQRFDKSDRPSVGASGSEGHGHGNSSLGHKRKQPPNEQKKKKYWIKVSRSCLKQNFSKGLRPALALIVVSRVTSLEPVLSLSLSEY